MKVCRYGPRLYDQADLQLVTTAIRLSRKLRKTVDELGEMPEDKLSRSEAIRRLVERALASEAKANVLGNSSRKNRLMHC